jgi:hypothetical protein
VERVPMATGREAEVPNPRWAVRRLPAAGRGSTAAQGGAARLLTRGLGRPGLRGADAVLIVALQRTSGNQVVQRLVAPAVVQRGRVSYYGVDDYREERKLLGGKTTELKSQEQLNEGLAGLADTDVMGVQTHGQWASGKTATNKVLWQTIGADAAGYIDAKAFVADIRKRGMDRARGSAFTLNLVSCFTAGTREQWTDPKLAAAFDIRTTFGYQAAALLLAAGYRPGTRLIGYIGQSKFVYGISDIGGQGGGDIPDKPTSHDHWDSDPRTIKPGWEVIFTIGNGKVETTPGKAAAATLYGKACPTS